MRRLIDRFQEYESIYKARNAVAAFPPQARPGNVRRKREDEEDDDEKERYA